MATKGEQQYIFNEREFEGDDFHAASFVAKYRRVTSLESLRDQLRGYSSGLKDQLYDTINRDYKDFIDIATKLEGVDSRVQHLKKPLIDLRIEALSLHDGIVTSLDAIQQKLRKKSELRQRALLLETTLSCMSKFDDVDRLLAALDPPAKRTAMETDDASLAAENAKLSGRICSRRSDLARFTTMREAKRIAHETAFKKGTERAKHQLSYQQTQYTKILHVLRSQLLKASEQERAAYALASAKKSITLLAERLEQHAISTSTSKPTRNNAVSISSSASVGELTDRASRLEASVVSRSHEILSQVLVSAPSLQPEIQDAQNEAAEMSCRQLRSRVFGHVLRTLHVLGHGEVALSILAENIVYPLARSILSQGRVDGTGGRGFYAGLEEALVQITEALNSDSGVPDMVTQAEDIFVHPDSGEVPDSSDFLVHGIWKPVATVLAERFHSMFSVGVAVAMHRAFSALDRFSKEIPKILLSGKRHSIGNSAFEALVRTAQVRLCRHPEVVGFRNKWKLDLYFQLRRQEITTRLEYAISLLCPMGTDNVWSLSSHSNASNTMELAYFSEQQPIQATAVTNKSAVSAKPMPGAVSVTVPLAARSVIPRTISPDIARTAVEEVTSAVSVFIGNGGVKFKLALVQAVVIEIYSCLHITVFLTPLAGPFLALIMQLFARLEAQICAAIPQINPPSFAGHEAIVKALAQANTAATAGASYTTIDDLVDLLGDLMLLRSWMASELPRTVSTMIIGDAILEREALVSLQGAINKSLSVQSAKTLSLMNGVWTRLCSMICIDCKSSLQAVKGVAGKYRLTNKPPPDSASPFVSTILNPLREFMSKNAETVKVIRACLPDGASSSIPWQSEIVEDITAAYLLQVQSLLETARQMDSVFMKRSKGAVASAPKTGVASLSDSEKIALQMVLDINAFEIEIKGVDIEDPYQIISFSALHNQIADMKKHFPNLSS